ncbi:MAG: hypothetical protein P8127_17395, partial [Acidobacteriota bacterium]
MFGRCELDVDLARDRRRHVPLEGEHVFRAALEVVRPQVTIGAGVDELHCDQDPVARPVHRSLDDCVDVEGLRDLGGRGAVSAPELHRRAARDHPDLTDPGEISGQGVGHSLGEVVLTRIARVVVEGEHGDGPDLGCGRGSRAVVAKAHETCPLEQKNPRGQKDDRGQDLGGGRPTARPFYLRGRLIVTSRLKALHCRFDFPHALVAGIRVLFEAAGDDTHQLVGQPRERRRQAAGSVAQDGRPDLGGRSSRERSISGRHLEQHHAERKDVRR